MTYPQCNKLLDFVRVIELIENLTLTIAIVFISICYKKKRKFISLRFFILLSVDKLWIRMELPINFTLEQ